MAALPYMQLYVADYLADTMHLSTEEHGAYLLLIFNYWQTGKPIPKVRLARIARLTNDRWLSVEDSLKEFFNDNGTEWEHDRIDRDLAAVHAAQEQKAAAGKASAQARKKKKQTEPQREINDRSNSVEGSFEQNPTIIDTDTDTDLKETPPPAREDDFDSRVRFAMTADWQPSSKTFQAVLLQMGITQQAFDQDQFLEFRSFWCASPDDHRTQAKWEHALASHLKRNLRQAQAGGNTHANSRTGAGPAQQPGQQRRLSAVDRVEANVAAQRAARGEGTDTPQPWTAGETLDHDDPDLRQQVDQQLR